MWTRTNKFRCLYVGLLLMTGTHLWTTHKHVTPWQTEIARPHSTTPKENVWKYTNAPLDHIREGLCHTKVFNAVLFPIQVIFYFHNRTKEKHIRAETKWPPCHQDVQNWLWYSDTIIAIFHQKGHYSLAEYRMINNLLINIHCPSLKINLFGIAWSLAINITRSYSNISISIVLITVLEIKRSVKCVSL